MASFPNFPMAESVYTARVEYQTGFFLAARTNLPMVERMVFQTETFQVFPGMAFRATYTVRLQLSTLTAARYRGPETLYVNAQELGF